MATSPRDRLDNELGRIRALDDAEIVDALEELAIALDEAKTRHKWYDSDGRHTDYPPRTVERYVAACRKLWIDGIDLFDVTAEELNAHIDWKHDEEGLAKTTLQGYQLGAKKFFQYFDVGVDPADVHVYKETSEPRHDETDMFTQAEADALRSACGETRNPTRNRALLEVLIFTAQRIRAIVTLRVGDVDVEDGHIYLNDEVDGLKGALGRGRKRPLFGARKYVRDHIQYNRSDADPEDWLFKGDPTNHWTDPDDHYAEGSAHAQLGRIADTAGVDKPVNPHNFRHVRVGELRANPEVSNDQIRQLLGVADNSDIFKTTYSHIEDGVFIDQIEEATGYKEADAPARSIPEACPTCGELLKETWSRCPACGELFGDEAEDLVDTIKKHREEIVRVLLSGDIDAEEQVGTRALGASLSDSDGVAGEALDQSG